MSDTQHAPTPWEVESTPCMLKNCNSRAHHSIESCGKTVVNVAGSLSDVDAGFICRACNCHDELVAVCQELVTALQKLGVDAVLASNIHTVGVDDPNAPWTCLIPVYTKAQAMLAKVKDQ